MRRLALLLLLTISGACPAAKEGEKFVDLVVPLNRDGTYSLRAFCQACNETLKSEYPLDRIEDRAIPLNKGLLKLAKLVGLDARLEPARLVLRLPKPDCAAGRAAQRRQLERLLDVRPGTWLTGLGLSAPEGFDASAPAILFVHGLQSSTDCFKTYADGCKQRGIQVLTFDYPNRGNLQEAGERLAKELHEFQASHPRSRLVIVSHSMGRLVSRHALEVKGANLSCITDLFLLGVPHQGSKLARHEPLLNFIENGRRAGSLRTGFGEAGCDLEPGSKFLKQLADAKRNKAVRYHLFAGSRGLVKPSELPELSQRYAGFLDRLHLPHEERARRLAYLEGLDEIVTGKGDVAVSVASATALAESATRRVLPLDHWQLLADPDGVILPLIVQTVTRRPR